MEKSESKPNPPTAADAACIAERTLGEPVARVERFATGLANHVYDVTAKSGAAVVVRITTPGSDTSVAAAVYWSNRLRPMGVPLPRLIAHQVDENGRFGWMALERLPGTDLWHVYHTLSAAQKRAIVDRLVEMQRIVQSLPAGDGYGYVPFPKNWPHRTYVAMIRDAIEVARRGIEQVGVVDVRHVARLERFVPAFADYFAQVRPTPFLHDTTTKNVIIDARAGGRLSGIVDVDDLCYGDPMHVIALTRMALLSLGQPTKGYIDYWLDRVRASPGQRRATTFYAAMCCVHFLSEQGQQYNRDAPPAVDPMRVAQLESILDMLLAELEGRV